MELLYTIQHKIGADVHTREQDAKENQLFAYGQKAFRVSLEQHNRLLSVTNKAKVTTIYLHMP